MDVTKAPSEKELNQLLSRTSKCPFRPGYVTIKSCLLPEKYRLMEKTIKEFEVFDTDVWICGFPKTGTTWISEIAWLLANDFDYESAKIPDYKRTRMLEFTMLFDVDKDELIGRDWYEIDSVGHAREQKHPRTIKSHFPFSVLPDQISNGIKKPKIIYTARNPMDTCVSYYYHVKNFEHYTGTLEEFCTLFMFDKVNYGPYHSHVLSFWERREEPNIFFTTYEEMKQDLPAVIKKVAKLLGKTISEQDIKKLEDYVSFDSMKKNPAVNKEFVIKSRETKGSQLTPFIRAGKSGGYKSVMSPEVIAQFRYWMGKKFEGSGLNLLDD